MLLGETDARLEKGFLAGQCIDFCLKSIDCEGQKLFLLLPCPLLGVQKLGLVVNECMFGGRGGAFLAFWRVGCGFIRRCLCAQRLQPYPSKMLCQPSGLHVSKGLLGSRRIQAYEELASFDVVALLNQNFLNYPAFLVFNALLRCRSDDVAGEFTSP